MHIEHLVWCDSSFDLWSNTVVISVGYPDKGDIRFFYPPSDSEYPQTIPWDTHISRLQGDEVTSPGCLMMNHEETGVSPRFGVWKTHTRRVLVVKKNFGFLRTDQGPYIKFTQMVCVIINQLSILTRSYHIQDLLRSMCQQMIVFLSALPRIRPCWNTNTCMFWDTSESGVYESVLWSPLCLCSSWRILTDRGVSCLLLLRIKFMTWLNK